MELFFQDVSSWLQGVLFFLIMYHAASYFFTKDKSFAIYACYLGLVMLYLIPKTQNFTSTFITEKFESFFNTFNYIIQILYWMLYCWFSIHFLSLKEKNINLAVQIMLFILITTIISTFFFLVDFFLFDGVYIDRFFVFIFVPISLTIISFLLKTIYHHNDKMNVFFVFGLCFLLGFSIIPLCFSNLKTYPFTTITPIDFFKIGVLLKAITLSIGLGYKYYLYGKEPNDCNSLLISELQKNAVLKEKLNTKFSKKGALYTTDEIDTIFESEIHQLQFVSLLGKMNPNFIINAINSIKQFIILNKVETAKLYLNKLSSLVHKILEASTTKQISLQEELETMHLYMSIENSCFYDKIDFTVSADEALNLNTIKVPPFFLQPFLEHAIWNRLSSKKNNKRIVLSIRKKNKNYLKICIKDNGIRSKTSSKITSNKPINQKYSDINLSEARLYNLVKNFKNNCSITYKDLQNTEKVTGTKVVIKFPLK